MSSFFLLVGLVLSAAVRADSWSAPAGAAVSMHRAAPDADRPLAPDADLIAERGVFIDRTGKVDIHTAPQQAYEPAAPFVFFGNQTHTVWLRLKLRPAEPGSTWWLVLGPPFLHAATLYTPNPAGGWQSQGFGSRRSFAERPVGSLNFVAPLALEPGQPVTLYLQINTPSPTAEVRVLQPQRVLTGERTQVAVFTLYFGAVMVVLVVSVLAYFSTRLVFWLSAAAYDLATVFSTLVQSGVGAAFLAPHADNLFNQLHPVAALLHIFCGFNLYAHVTQLIKGPRWAKWGYWCGMAMLPILLGLLLSGKTALALHINNQLGFFGSSLWGLVLVFGRTEGDLVLSRAVKAITLAASLYFFAFFAPWVPALPVSPDLQRFTAMPANLFGIVMAFIVAYRLSQLDAREKRRLALESHEHQRRQAAAEAQSQAKSAFLAYMSHEMRTPLNAVVGLAELASGPAVAPATRDHYLHMLKESATALTSVVSDVLDLSKIEAGKLEVDRVEFDLLPWLEALAASQGALANRKGLRFATEHGGSTFGRVRGDPVRLGQVLGNFLSNALKFTDEGQITLSARRVAPGRYRFEVHDTGRGLDAQDQERLFQAYAQAEGDARVRAGGTGLGLAISRELARLMGGEVGVRSERGRGSCFWLEVDLPEVSGPGVASPTAASAAADALRHRRILVAEDDPLNRSLMDALLRREGADPTTAADGAEALALIRRAHEAGQPFDIAFLDIHMRGMDGLEAVRRIRGLGPAGRLAVVALTGSALADERRQALQAGMDDLLTKPVLIARLREVVQRLVASAPATPIDP